jgi:hypothetical protein
MHHLPVAELQRAAQSFFVRRDLSLLIGLKNDASMKTLTV